ncbi:MAG: hypothetical protein CMN58_04870 [Solibacterales bacterium]|nr:hypothetical protein [Bryobacterales bacterium]|tara:strand:+ start:15111 stop:18056 length:2946 start_codon:yes stop_codon:yes gene_type:complete
MRHLLKLSTIITLALPTLSAMDLEQRATTLIAKSCLGCHSEALKTAGLVLNNRTNAIKGGDHGPALVPGSPAKSLLNQKIASGEMPVGNPLPKEDRDVIHDWIMAGAPWGKTIETEVTRRRSDRSWWSFQPLQSIELPTPRNLPSTWKNSPIDIFLFSKMMQKGLHPNPRADRRTLLRRVTFDLIGLPPTPEEIDAFLADRSSDAYEKVIDRLLNSPHYGERWGRHWLDVVRFGESDGYEQNFLRDDAWPYRDYVVRSLNEDKPFNRMIVEQLAGDQLTPWDLQSEAATGFLVAGPYDTVGIDNIEGKKQQRANELDDMVMATASSFLGLTVNCARCHDHKFDPIEQRDYYRMQSVFAGVRHVNRRQRSAGVRVWATEAQKAAYESRAKPLQQKISEAEADLQELYGTVKDRIRAQRDEIFARYRPSVTGYGTEEKFAPVEARYLRFNIETVKRGRPTSAFFAASLDELEIWTTGTNARNIALARHGAKASASSTRKDDANPDTYSPMHVIDGKFDRGWMSQALATTTPENKSNSGRKYGAGTPLWIQIEWPEVQTISRIYWSSDRLKAFGETYSNRNPERYTIEVSRDGKHWNKVADSFDRLPAKKENREELLFLAVLNNEERKVWNAAERTKSDAKAKLAKLPKLQTAYLAMFKQPEDPTYLMKRGDPMARGEIIAPASLTTLSDLLYRFEMDTSTKEGARRLALARWIADDRNALTARVIVNRIWMYHFGASFVETPSDFGINGGKPTHPELFEWLSNRFVKEYRWRWKPLHKEIVMSEAYRQSSTYNATQASIDADARYLWRFPPKRLEAEAIRDAVLAVSGNLDRTMGGKGFQLYRYTVDNVATYYPIQEFDKSTFRRAVYHQHARSVKPELLGQYDCPDTALPAPKRVVTTSPLQALSLFNNSFVLQQARSFAERLERETRQLDVKMVIIRAYELAFGRKPTGEEMKHAEHFISDYGLFPFCRALLNANEFVYLM